MFIRGFRVRLLQRLRRGHPRLGRQLPRRPIIFEAAPWPLACENDPTNKRVEKSFEDGQLAGTSRWSAIITVSLTSPTTAEALKKNPLGLFIHAINWSQDSV